MLHDCLSTNFPVRDAQRAYDAAISCPCRPQSLCKLATAGVSRRSHRWREIPADCAELIRKPNPRPIKAISKVHLLDEAYIGDVQLSHRHIISTSVQLNLTSARRPQDDPAHLDKWINSTIRMMRIPAPGVPESDPQAPPVLPVPQCCRHKPREREQKLDLFISEAEADRFLARVCTVSLEQNTPMRH
jgi:hypothetical protein